MSQDKWRKDAEVQSLNNQLEMAKQDIEKLKNISKMHDAFVRMPDFMLLEGVSDERYLN